MINDALWAQIDAIPGWMGREECVWLAELASRSRSWTEVGVYCGRSLLAVGLHLGKGLPPGERPHLCAVDLAMNPNITQEQLAEKVGNPQDVHLDEVRAFLPAVLLRLREARSDLSIACYGVSSLLAAQVASDSDVVFLDASHSYESVKADILAWRGKCVTLAGHDYQRNWIGVVNAVDELCPGAKNPVDALWCWGPDEGKPKTGART